MIFANLSVFFAILGGFWAEFAGFGPKKVAGGTQSPHQAPWGPPGGQKCENVLFFGAFLGPFGSPNWAQNRPGPFSELLK